MENSHLMWCLLRLYSRGSMLMLGSKSNSKLVSNQLVSNVPPNWPRVCNGWNNRIGENINFVLRWISVHCRDTVQWKHGQYLIKQDGNWEQRNSTPESFRISRQVDILLPCYLAGGGPAPAPCPRSPRPSRAGTPRPGRSCCQSWAGPGQYLVNIL